MTLARVPCLVAVWLSAQVGATSAMSSGRIAFDHGGIRHMDTDGRSVSVLTEQGDNHPAWSPDGTQIVCARRVGETQFDIIVMDVDGTDPVNLTRHPSSDTKPAWSPDGSKIAFESSRDDGTGTNDIFVMNVDGSNQRNLTREFRKDTDAAWSPDGERIVFRSMRDSTDVAGLPPDTVRTEIYTMVADGSDPQRLTYDGWNYEPDWSQDGASILFRRYDGRVHGLFMMAPDGSDLRLVAVVGSLTRLPVLSPDGTQIAYQDTIKMDGRNNAEIFAMDIDGSNRRNLTNHPASDGAPDWFDPRYSPAFTPAFRALFQWGWLKQLPRGR